MMDAWMQSSPWKQSIWGRGGCGHLQIQASQPCPGNAAAGGQESGPQARLTGSHERAQSRLLLPRSGQLPFPECLLYSRLSDRFSLNPHHGPQPWEILTLQRRI